MSSGESGLAGENGRFSFVIYLLCTIEGVMVLSGVGLLTFDSIVRIWLKKIHTRIPPNWNSETTKKLKNMSKLILDEVK
jgi:hypothetical protein